MDVTEHLHGPAALQIADIFYMLLHYLMNAEYLISNGPAISKTT